MWRIGVAVVPAVAFVIGGGLHANMAMTPFTKQANVLEKEVVTNKDWTRTTEWFVSEGERCHAWLYIPTSSAADGEVSGSAPVPHPVVVLGHGMGGQKDTGLEVYAEAFSTLGFASFVFDYRTFGGSDGMPRHLVQPWRHIQDYKSALAHIRSTAGLGGRVDPSRLGLWGTSFAGGHVLEVTAADEASQGSGNPLSIKAVISQIPHLDGRAASKRSMKLRGVGGVLRLALAAFGDLLRSWFGLPAGYIQIVGNLGDLALMPLSSENLVSYFKKHPKEHLGGWRNLACARVGLMVGMYSPKNVVPKVNAPILFVGAERDKLCPMEDVRKAASAAQAGQLSSQDCDHFDMYSGEPLQAVLRDMGNFLDEHLKGKTT